MLLANNLSFERNGKEIFKELNISISPGKIIHLHGHVYEKQIHPLTLLE